MSGENADVVRRWFGCLAEGSPGVELCAPEIRIDNVAEFPQRLVGRFRHTGIALDVPWGSIVTVGGVKIVRAQGYGSRNQAFRAAGLPDP